MSENMKTFSELMAVQDAPKTSEDIQATYQDLDGSPSVVLMVRPAGTVYAKVERKVSDGSLFVTMRTFKGRIRQSNKFGGFYAVPVEQFSSFVTALETIEKHVDIFAKAHRK